MKTAESLRQLGCQADVSLELKPRLIGYDLVHLFNLSRPQEGTLQALNARSHGSPVALSTVYLRMHEYEKLARHGFSGKFGRYLGHSQREYLKVMARAVVNGEINAGVRRLFINGYRNSQEQLLQCTNVLLPNSQSELERVYREFPTSVDIPGVVVPNGIDPQLFTGRRSDDELEKYRGCVLCAARIEGRKNQVNLVRAMEGLPYQLVLVGKAAPNHRDYLSQVLSEAGPNVTYLGAMDPEALARLYSVARVHVLASWGETPGLSSLEAAASGCNLVITNYGDTFDYFGEFAWYCEPDSVTSIRSGISQSYDAPFDNRLRERILQNFTWEHAARRTMEAYEVALGATAEVSPQPPQLAYS
jgi:glycosyltransferase involved in cell wall biosynthesis